MNLPSIKRNAAEFGRAFAVLTVIVLFVMIPLIQYAEQSVSASYAYVRASVDDFVNHVALNGVIRIEDYELLSEKLYSTGTIYDIELLAAQRIITVDSCDVQEVFYTDEIIEKLYDDGKYDVGNKLVNVSIKPVKPSLAQIIADKFTGKFGNGGYSVGWKQ